MKHFLTYVNYSYQVIVEAETKLNIMLEKDTEAYVVHLFAKYLDNPKINQVPICIRLMEGSALPNKQKKAVFLKSAEECLLIDGLELAKARWPTLTYYRDLGIIAYDQIAHVDRLPNELYLKVAENFSLLSQVLKKCKVSGI